MFPITLVYSLFGQFAKCLRDDIMNFMKIWMKYIIGILLGIAGAFVFKFNTTTSLEKLSYIVDICIRVGRYCVVPLVSTTAAISLYKLIQAKAILKTAVWSAIVMVSASLLLTIIGVIAITLVKLPRIPITVERSAAVNVLGIRETVRSLFPYSGFEALSNGIFLFVPFLFALCVGWAFSRDEETFRPAIQLVDSLSKLFYLVNKVATEILSVGLIAISCMWVVQFREVISNETFMPIFIMLLVLLLIVAVLIYPLIIYLTCHDTNPYRILYALVAPLFVALLSGDANLVLPVAMRHTYESLGIRRRINGIVSPLLSIFARAGTGLVLSISFIVIRRSYSDLAIPFADMMWLLLFSFLFSFALGGMASGGTFVALSVLCTMYGRGFEAGFLLLRPIAFLLGSFAAAFNILTLVFGSYIVAVKTGNIERHSIRRFI